jgi:hypothetical protein
MIAETTQKRRKSNGVYVLRLRTNPTPSKPLCTVLAMSSKFPQHQCLVLTSSRSNILFMRLSFLILIVITQDTQFPNEIHFNFKHISICAAYM